ncbi:MAG TPA: SBBP repeat-containing protein [Pyrinomonadaceae bacterium]
MNLHIYPFPRINRIVLTLGFVCLLAISIGVILVGAHKDERNDSSMASADPLNASDKTRINRNFGQLPLSFEINKGQLDEVVKFMSHGAGYDLFLTANETVLRVHKPRDQQEDKLKDLSRTNTHENVREGTVLRLKMLGASSSPQVAGQDELPGKVNYFIGNDPAKWRRNIPTYRKAFFKDVYPGIDMVYYGQQRELEYDFVVGAGANPKLIRFSVEGADQIRLDKTGKLLLRLKHGDVVLNRPLIYQLDENGSRREVKGTYVINGNEIRFKLQRFDSSKPLVIDPVLSYSTLLGSGSNETAFGIAVDSQGSAYVTGTTDGTTFPTTSGAFKSTSTRSGAFITKLDATGSSLIYSTYLNGIDGITDGLGIAVDSSGNAHVTGTTSASDFPIVNGLKTTSPFFKTTDAAAHWNNQNSGLAGSVSALAVAPSAPNTIYATTSNGFYRSTNGGTTWTKIQTTGLTSFTFTNALAVDPANASVIYIGQFGLFKSTDNGSNWTSVNTGGGSSIFSIVFDPSTPSTMYLGSANGVLKTTNSGSTWILQNNFGIPGTPSVRSLAIDPTTPLTLYAGTFSDGLFKSINGGGVWTAANNGMGGSDPTNVSAIVIDPANPATIYTGHGSTPAAGGINQSTNGGTSWGPLTNGVPNAGVNAMVATSSAVYAAINSRGVIKTTNGGSSWTNTDTGLWTTAVLSLVKDPNNASVLYAAGTGSGFSDAFVTKLNPSGSGLLFSTLIGGSKQESGNGIAVDASGNITVVGSTTSLNFPFANAIRSNVTFNGNCTTGFVTKLNPSVPSYTFSTYLGGGECDVAYGVATDSSANIYVTGRTASADFPIANAIQPIRAGAFDAFVSKLTPDGSLIYSTYLGGANGADTGFGIAADSSGNAYVTGSAESTNFPTINPIQACTGLDAFVTKLSSDGSTLAYSTCLGGGAADTGRSIAVDSANNAYVTGATESLNFPLVAGALRTRSGLYKSVDGAATWSNDNYGLGGAVFTSVSFPSPGASALAIHPTNTSTLYAATAAGVFKSTNGGRTWSARNNGLPSGGVGLLVMDPVTPSTLYATSSTFGSSGVYKTTDGGATWNLRSTGLINSAINSLVIDPVTPNILYVAFEGCCTGMSRIYRTTNGADSWAVAGTSPPSGPMALTIDPLSPSTLYVGDGTTPGTVFKSTNSGGTWQPLGSISFARSFAVSPHTAGVVYAGTDQGIFKSTDGGNSWSPFSPKIGKIVFDPVSSSTLYLVTTQFNSPPEGLFKSTDNGQTWIQVNKGLNTPHAVVLAIDPLRPSTLYLASVTVGGIEGFVTKVNPAGSALIYSTFIGGAFNSQNIFNVTAQSNGIALDASGDAYITGTTTAPGFPVSPNAFQPFNRGQSDVFISKLTMSHLISGQVLDGGGLPVGGAEIILNDGTSLLSVLTENDGSYQFSRLRQGGTFTVSASKPHFTMAPVSQTFNNLNSDQVLNFTATATNAPFHTISGQVTENGVALPGVTVTLSGSQPGLRTTDSNGNYSFELADGGNYTVTPSLLGFNFGPTSQAFNALTANQTANFAATRQSFVVTNANNHGAGSLRDAIVNANATIGKDTIVFNIPGSGVKTITLLNALPEITDPVVIDATTQPGYAGTPLVEIDGLAVTDFAGNGLAIKAGGSTVRGLAIGNFRNGAGILLNGCDNNLIQGNYLGVDADGTTQRQNNRGIVLTNSSNNVIGGTSAATRNVISGNAANAVDIAGSSNVIQGNFIGTNAAGTAQLSQPGGVTISGLTSTNNLIGGTATGAGNLISGNQFGVSTQSPGTTIQGNLIGTDITGTKKIPNSTRAIQAIGENMMIGGVTPGARNVISGNNDGVFIRGAGGKVQGNYIGTDITGTQALGNSGNGVTAGDGALIGGTVPEARNIISANGSFGNVALGINGSGTAATVRGNYIGTDVTGTRSLSNPSNGISILSNNNIIGGLVAGAGNLISGNAAGIVIQGFSGGLAGNVIQGNFIGTNAAGTGPVPNLQQGIVVTGAVNNTIGGTQTEAANTIAYNGGPGISLTNGTGIVIRGNSIFSNNGLGIDLGADGVTANDNLDADVGPNTRQNFPVVTTVLSTSNSTTIQGSLSSLPITTFDVDFYSSAAVDPSGNGEGARFVGTTQVTTNGNGNATINVTFPVALAPGRIITATATDPNGNTSEFSAADPNTANGSVQFTVSSIQLIEDVGTVTLTAQRTGGTVGNLSVDYSTTDGTAIAGQDYTATSGTLNFSAGETSKTIQIPILDDATTETSESFTVALRNNTNPERVGAPSTVFVTVLDHATTPQLTINNVSVVEGNAGATTDAVFTISLSAATGRSVTGNYATGNLSAFGGASCGTQGVDYESRTGTFSFTPGSTTLTIPIKICGDTSAEADEQFRVQLTNTTGAFPAVAQVFGLIVNDDVLELVLEESGPTPDQAAVLDSLRLVRDPIPSVIPDWFPTGPDRNTRVTLFARNLHLDPGEPSAAVVVRFTGSNSQSFDVQAQDVRGVANSDLTQVVVRLPDNLAPGTWTVSIRAHTRTSNTGTIRIAP